MDRSLQALQEGLFGTLHIMSKDTEISATATIALSLLNALQMLAFPLSSSPVLPWQSQDQPVISSIGRVLEWLTTDTLEQRQPVMVVLVLFWAALVWIASFLAMIAYVGFNFVRNRNQKAWLLKLLRGVARLSTTFLFLPSTSILMRILYCPGENWLGETSISCWSATHIAIMFLAIILLIVFSALCIFIAAVFINRNPIGQKWDAKAHGRVDVFMLCAKLVLGFVYNVLIDSLSPGITTAIVSITAALWLLLYVKWVPHVNVSANCLEISLGAVYMLGTICLVLAQIFPGYDMGIAFLLCLLPAAIASWMGFAAWFRELLLQGDMDSIRFHNAFIMDAWVRVLYSPVISKP